MVNEKFKFTMCVILIIGYTIFDSITNFFNNDGTYVLKIIVSLPLIFSIYYFFYKIISESITVKLINFDLNKKN